MLSPFHLGTKALVLLTIFIVTRYLLHYSVLYFKTKEREQRREAFGREVERVKEKVHESFRTYFNVHFYPPELPWKKLLSSLWPQQCHHRS